MGDWWCVVDAPCRDGIGSSIRTTTMAWFVAWWTVTDESGEEVKWQG